MDELKKFIDNHREEFEERNMPEGLEERIMSSAGRQRRTPHSNRLWATVSIAAAAVACLLLIVNTVLMRNVEKAASSVAACNDETLQVISVYRTELYKRLEHVCNEVIKEDSHDKEYLLDKIDELKQESREVELSIMSGNVPRNNAEEAFKRYYSSAMNGLDRMESGIERRNRN